MFERRVPEFPEMITFVCPHCRAELMISEDDAWSGWRICPACSRPSLPPELSDLTPSPWQSVGLDRQVRLQINTVTAPESWDDLSPRAFREARKPQPTSWFRRGLATGFAGSLFGVLYAFLEQDDVRLAFFSLVSLISLMLLIRPKRRV